MPSRIGRRQFLGTTAKTSTAAGLALAAGRVHAQQSASDKVVVGIMGLSRGRSLAVSFAKRPNVEVKYVCDVDIKRELEDHPNAKVMAHPECPLPIRDLADYLLSTGQMCTHAKASDEKEFIVATEMGLLYRLRNENPEKKFYSVSDRALCPNMKKIDLEKVLWSLEDMQHQIIVPEEIADKARLSIERMLELS